MNRERNRAELIAAIVDKLEKLSDKDVLRVLAAYEASQKREKE